MMLDCLGIQYQSRDSIFDAKTEQDSNQTNFLLWKQVPNEINRNSLEFVGYFMLLNRSFSKEIHFYCWHKMKLNVTS